jgi:AcrR family transcriptional regulator
VGRPSRTRWRKALPSDHPLARFEAAWSGILDSFDEYRPLWTAMFEALAQVAHSPDLQRFLADAAQHGRQRMAAGRHGEGVPADAERTRARGAFHQALLIGVMAQRLMDPARSPTGHDLGDALRAIVAEVHAAK